MSHGHRLFPFFLVVGCGGTPATPEPAVPSPPPPPPAPIVAAPEPSPVTTDAGAASPAGPAQLTAKPLALPSATAPISVDYLAIDRAHGRVWVPVGDNGSAYVFDIAANAFSRVEGFKTGERDIRGKKRVVGPSAASVGDGVVYIGNRATSEVCPVNGTSMKLGKCLKVASPSDGVSYVASSKEVWVTTPRDHSLTVLDASKPDALKAKLVIKLDGETEGYAVDETRGLFFTNLEDKDKTVVVDIKTHAAKATYSPGCGGDGPRGVAVDTARNFVIVACTDHLQVLDAGHEGALLGKLDTGAGVDNIDYVPGLQTVYAVAGRAAKLSVVRLDDKGQLTLVATAATTEGTRNTVADDAGNAYVLDGTGARLWVVPAPPK